MLNSMKTVAVLGMCVILAACGRSEAQQASAAEREAQKRAAGQHCVTGWDGYHIGVRKWVNQRLRDPDSFQHVRTEISPERNGRHALLMTYRARNGFGGMTQEQVGAWIDNKTCRATML